MLLVLSVWLLASLLCWIYGETLLGLFRSEGERLHITFSLLAGAICLTGLSGFAVLFIPMSPAWISVLTGGGAFLMGAQHRRLGQRLIDTAREIRDTPLPIIALCVLFLFLALAHQVIPPVHYDEGLYYLQTIKWFNEYGTVPGLGNLHTRLAFNSNWHLFASLWSFPQITGATLDDVNGLLTTWFSLLPLGALKRAWKREEIAPRDWLMALLSAFHFVFFTAHTAPAADLAVALLLWAVAYLWLGGTKSRTEVFLLWLLGGFLLTVKLSVAPIAMLFLALFLLQRNLKFHLPGILAGALLLLPWLARNVMLSGYLAYPLPGPDLFDFDWEVPRNVALQELCSVKAWARLPGKPCEEVNQMDFSEWMPMWFGAKKPYDKAILLLLPILVAFATLKIAVRHRSIEFRWKILWGVSVIGSLFWVLQAPDPRFGYGFLLLALALSALILLPKDFALFKSYPKFIPTSLLVGGTLMWAAVFVKFVPGSRKALQYPLIPAKAETNALFRKTPNGFFLLQASPTDQCWDAPLPCMPFANENVETRGATLREGFRWK